MTFIKTTLIGFAAISFCLADISGIVTDTAGTAIAGAVVKLEKGGQSDTTDSQGNFTLATTGIIRPFNRAAPDKQYVTLRNGLISVNAAEKSAIEITIFNINGKAHSRVHRSIDAGCKSIALPRQAAGIYLYKIKAGNDQFLLKGNTIRGISSASAVSFPGSSSGPLKKQASAAASTADIISATKTGYLDYRQGMGNSDTAGMAIRMIECTGTVTDIDGNEYQTVRIGSQVWTAQNLRVTKYNDGSPVPLDTSSETWESAATPKYCFYNNTADPGDIRKYGALYNWYVVDSENPKKIAPEGWHVPSDMEWELLLIYLIANGYNWDGATLGNKVAKAMAAKTDWRLYKTIEGSIGNDLSKNNASGFSALPGGIRGAYGSFAGRSGGNSMTSAGYWWSSTDAITGSIARCRCLETYNVDLGRINYSESWGFSVRLVKD